MPCRRSWSLLSLDAVYNGMDNSVIKGRRFSVLAITALAGVLVGGSWSALTTTEAFDKGQPGQTQSREAKAVTPVPPPTATFDPAFRSCAHCHQIGKNARNASGPVLTGVLGRKAGSTDYAYSRAMRESSIVWTEENLRAFIRRPQSVVPGTRMAFGGLPEAEIDELLEFLKKSVKE